jgi:uncharacterized alpha-E superfamily protein
MLCRVADGLYWIGRYLERAEHRARLLDVNLDLMLYQTPEDVAAGWRRLCRILHVPVEAGAAIDAYAVAQTASGDLDHVESIASCIARARENARQVREVISSDMWEQINHIFLRVAPPSVFDFTRGVPSGVFRALRRELHLFEGIADATFLHGEGWRFLRLGRYIERAIATTQLLAGYLGSLPQRSDYHPRTSDVTWVGLLRSCTALEAYTKKHTADPRPRNIMEFLLLSHEFPHSLRFSVEQACQVFQGMEGTPSHPAGAPTALARDAGRLRAQLEFTSVDEILAEAPAAYLTDVQARCMRIHDLVHEQYIAYPVELASVYA